MHITASGRLGVGRRGPAPQFPVRRVRCRIVEVLPDGRVIMSTTQMGGLVRTFTEEELLERRSDVVKALEHRFGSLERALEREQDWNYDEEESMLFSEYHAATFLLFK